MVVATSKIELNQTRALLSNVTYETLEKLDTDLAQTGARLTYLDGCLEIMAPLSDAHEEPRNTLGQLLEIYMRTKNIRFYGRGSTTIGMKELGARKEPDESYCLGTRKSVPDLAIEVIVTSGGIDTLEIYRRVGVSEVWFWEDGVISVYCLRSTGYELVSKSELLPELDLRSLEFYSRMADQYDAVNAFIQLLM
ncbi:Uma2 family endonuclease [Dolichospermum sp. ST_con]|nr:Uma2 family endonuclease [Dolichospermum sp. ST_con]MDD1421828.1 Uma2 family endonuclease [Dolichospermum sp. ST_sed1]MDD1427083.1 Uma2 family endonuclease [Dolichospermum sp. ST_sed9]MDD1433897.1 Uma2 family endonuclease [Dolichospermum sp. ST_sed6]MDD1437114.1 Uma2 family endonuclease [Dolichospermum sp. ST_sed10]MDD1443237.1 Uma2 family endonuclease [Dolichospermum sp. ST_sed3]MDD1448917.1 Uma2 family endonuclease [Dolichospermum sp. ST_sed8]MDD1457511.1 Uma2 family endonuclease [Dolic